jgi:hypothetical protein
MAGATSDQYTIPLASRADDTARFTVRVSNGFGSIESQAAILTVTPMPSVGSATLAAGVRLLSDSEATLIVSSRSDEIVFSANPGLTPGTVVVGSARAFKIQSIRVSGTQWVATITEPDLNELLANLRVRGTYAVGTAQILAAGAKTNLSRTFTQSEGGLTLTSTLSSDISATVDYDYQRDNGGLRLARLDIDVSTALQLSALYQAGAMAQFERRIGAIRIPIAVSVVDAALRVIGVRVVSIFVPFYVGARTSADFQLQSSGTVTVTGSFRALYTPAAGPQLSSTFGGSITPLALNPTTPGGVPAWSTVALGGGLYVGMRPALAFLDQVALLGVDTSLSVDSTMRLQLVPASPAYCLSADTSLNASANGFFKTVGLSLKTEAYTRELYKLPPAQIGSCREATSVSVQVSPTGRTRYGAPLSVTATVAARAGGPSAAPTGSVQIDAEGAVCRATLSAAGIGTATATCSLVPRAAGTQVPLRAAYTGDIAYSPSVASATVAIENPPATLLGVRANAAIHYPTLGTPATLPVQVPVGPGIEFTSGTLTLLVGGISVIGASVDIGGDYIDIAYSQSATSLTAPFNGSVFDFPEASPPIVGCRLGNLSTFTANQVNVACSSHRVAINGSGIQTTPRSRIFVELTLGN